MPNVRIVTDSAAQFLDPDFVSEHNVTVVPLSLTFNGQSAIPDVELDNSQFITRLAAGEIPPLVSAPSRNEFIASYEDIATSSTQLLSIHSSAKLTDTVQNARQAAADLMGKIEAPVMDSRTTSVGLGMLVEELAIAANTGASLGELVRKAHGLIPRVYGVFFVESLDYLEYTGRFGPAQSTLGAMLGIKPILALEDGEIIPMEKVRTRAQGIEKLIEFVTEFTDLERLTVLHSHPNGDWETRLLLDRLSTEFPDVACPTLLFSPVLATQIGPYGLGVIIFDSEASESDL